MCVSGISLNTFVRVIEHLTLQWEENLSQTIVPPAYIFPEDDLLKDLFEIYFTKPNVLLPLLHRPTFEKLFQAEVHRKHQMFGAVVLLVCAIASRFSSDPRVLLDSENSRRSSGWKYFSQVQATTRSLLAPPTIYDLQYYTASLFDFFVHIIDFL